MAEQGTGSPSLEDIISRHGLAKEKLQEKCSEEIRLKIAAKLEDWKIVGRYLNIPSEKLKAIELDNDTEEQRRIAMLDTWYDREGEGASYLRLADALCQHGCRSLVELLCKLILESSVQELSSDHNIDRNAELSPFCMASIQPSSGKVTSKSCESGLS